MSVILKQDAPRKNSISFISTKAGTVAAIAAITLVGLVVEIIIGCIFFM